MQLFNKMDNILNYFYEYPEKEFYVRDIARLVKKSPTTVSKYLKKFEKEGLLNSVRKYNHLFFRANTDNKMFKEKKTFYYIQEIRKSGLIDYLTNTLNNPQSIVLFGSFSKGESIKESDIDILIVTPLSKTLNVEKFEKKLGHKIQLFLHSATEIDTMKHKNRDLLNSFINGVLLEGYWEVIK